MTDDPTDRAASERGADEGPFRGLRNWLRQLRGESTDEPGLRASLEELIEEHEEEPIDPQERAILTNIVKLHEQTAADVMVPRVDIVALEVDTPFEQVVKSFVEHEGKSGLWGKVSFDFWPNLVFDDSSPSSTGKAMLLRRDTGEPPLQRCLTTDCRQAPVSAMTKLHVVA